MKITVDADACPRQVLQICLEKGSKYKLPVWTVAGFNHNISSDHHIVVGNDSQEAAVNCRKVFPPILLPGWERERDGPHHPQAGCRPKKAGTGSLPLSRSGIM